MHILLFVIFVHWATSETVTETDTPKEIRCYCNLAVCVETSYLCKSELGCFSDLTSNTDFDKAIHGCLELIPREKNTPCQNNPGASKSSMPPNTLLLCCQEDLCNHVDSPETRNKYNETIRAAGAVGMSESDEAQMLKGPTLRRPGYSSQEVWFKAATIAVPICGALILLMLILLAVKILKTDPQTLPPKFRGKGGPANLLSVVAHNPSVDTNMGPTSKKVPLLYQQNDCTTQEGNKSVSQEKNQANDKLNRSPDLIDLHLHKVSNRAPCNIYQPLIPPTLPSIHGTHYKQLYNKPLVCGWPNH